MGARAQLACGSLSFSSWNIWARWERESPDHVGGDLKTLTLFPAGWNLAWCWVPWVPPCPEWLLFLTETTTLRGLPLFLKAKSPVQA